MSVSDYSEAVGVFRDHTRAARAVDALRQAGIGDAEIQVTVYGLHEGGPSRHASEMKRIIVHVRAAGREADAIGIFFSYGANNADLPPGTRLEHGSIIGAKPETVDLIARGPATGGASNSLFGEMTAPGHPDEIIIADNPNAPHG